MKGTQKCAENEVHLMEGIFMYYRAEQILSAYPKEFTGNMKGRGSLLCTDREGLYLLKEYRGSVSRLELLDEVLRFLKENHFPAEELVRTGEGAPCYTDVDGVTYFLRKICQGRECDTKNVQELLYVVKQLAVLHQLLAGWRPQKDVTLQSMPEDYAARHTRELKKVHNYVRAKKKRNAFESEFLKSYEHYMAQAQKVLRLGAGAEVPADALQLCHGDFNQHNLLFTGDGLVVTGFDKMHYDLCVSDLTNFVRKILEKHNWNSGLGMDMIMAYNSVRQLEQWELQQVYLRLLYPEKYWKIVNHYYNARKTWVSGRDIEKLQRISMQETKREEFLSMLFYLIK